MKPSQEIITQKRNAWATMGETITMQEYTLQAMAQEAIININLPKNIYDIKDAEFNIKSLKSKKAEIESKRKQITSKFDELSKRLMEPEKLIDETIKKFTEVTISLKKELEAKQNELINQKKEESLIREFFLRARIQINENLLMYANTMALRAYTKAINDTIPINEVDDYIKKCKDSMNSFNRYETNLNEMPNSNNLELVQKIKDSIAPLRWEDYYNHFCTQLDHYFLSYVAALTDKIKGVQKAEEIALKLEENIKYESQVENISVKLNNLATDIIEKPEIKELKHSYSLDMPETIESMLTIMAAFSANVNLCMPHLRISKWLSFNADSAGKALAKVKSEDNNFNPDGVIFKEISKL